MALVVSGIQHIYEGSNLIAKSGSRDVNNSNEMDPDIDKQRLHQINFHITLTCLSVDGEIVSGLTKTLVV